MTFVLLDKKEQFEELKKGDFIIVKWWDNYVKHVPGCKRVMAYNIYQNKVDCKEIICQKKNNHYFNYERYLEGLSGALKVYRVIEDLRNNREE